MHTVFYDKFRFRSVTANVVDWAWQVPAFRTSLQGGGVHAAPPLQRFVNEVRACVRVCTHTHVGDTRVPRGGVIMSHGARCQRCARRVRVCV